MTVVILNIDYFKCFIKNSCKDIKDNSLHEWLYKIVLKYIMENEVCIFNDMPTDEEKKSIHVIKAIKENNKLMRFKEDDNLIGMINLILKWSMSLNNNKYYDFHKIYKYNFIQAFDASIKYDNSLIKKNNIFKKI